MLDWLTGRLMTALVREGFEIREWWVARTARRLGLMACVIPQSGERWRGAKHLKISPVTALARLWTMLTVSLSSRDLQSRWPSVPRSQKLLRCYSHWVIAA